MNGFAQQSATFRAFGRLIAVQICITGLAMVSLGCGGNKDGGAPQSLPPVIRTLIASSSSVDFGESVEISWELEGGDPSSLTLDGVDVLGKKTANRVPANRHVFTLMATNGGGTASKSITVAARGLDVVAGHADGRGYRDGSAREARLGGFIGIAPAQDGSVYFSDECAIRRMAPDGTVTTIAGMPGVGGMMDGVGSEARFEAYAGLGFFDLALDGSGNLYAADGYAGVRKIVLSTGAVTTLEGISVLPRGLAYDATSNRLYVSGIPRGASTKVQVVELDTSSVRDVPGTAAQDFMGSPRLMTVDGLGNLYVLDSINRSVFKVSLEDGTVLPLAYYGGYIGQGDGVWNGLGYDGSGHLIMASSWGTAITRIDTGSGEIALFAGSIQSSGQIDGMGTAARFSMLTGLKCRDGYAYFWDGGSIRKLNLATAEVTTLIGEFMATGYADGNRTQARFNLPTLSAVDAQGNVFVLDARNGVIRKISHSGITTTFLDMQRSLILPRAMVVDREGVLYLSLGHAVVKIPAESEMHVVAGDLAIDGYVEGKGASARFCYPQGLTIGEDGVIYVADTENGRIRKITPDGVTSSLAGSGRSDHSDGMGASAQFEYPEELALGPEGDLYVTDQLFIRTVDTSTGYVGTLADAKYASSLAVDGSGNLYGIQNHSIWKRAKNGATTVLCGNEAPPWCNVAGPLPASLYYPSGLSVTPFGDLIVCVNNGVMQITLP